MRPRWRRAGARWRFWAAGATGCTPPSTRGCSSASSTGAGRWFPSTCGTRIRLRNRLIAGLARATLIVEAGLPSGTFSTADEALAANRDVLVVPGAITAASSRGANRLIYQGATPVIDDETFEDALFSLFGCLKQETVPSVERTGAPRADEPSNPVADALRAEPLSMEQLYAIAASSCGGEDARSWLMERLVEAELAGTVARHPDGRWGPAVR